MQLPNAGAGMISLLLLGSNAVGAIPAAPNASPASDGSPAVSALYARNETLQSYTFHMDVAMAMRHFPWLHFHMQGTGEYDRGEKYVVHFAKMPWFAPQKREVDLSMIDPQMWPTRYTYQVIGQKDGDTIYALQGVGDNAQTSATVALNSLSGPQWIDATYGDGTHVRMSVSSSEVDGFLLPVALNASVDEPHMALSANADFKDYDLTGSRSK